MRFIKAILLCFLFNYVFSQPYKIPRDLIQNLINNIPITQEEVKAVIGNLSSTFSEAYTFNEISKNPPQPEFDKKYYEKIDIQERLKTLDKNYSNYFEFYQEIKKQLSGLKDAHLQLNFEKLSHIFSFIFFADPLCFKVKEYKNETKIFGDLRPEGFLINEFFSNSNEVIKVINENMEVPIKSINGIEPFEFISSFGGEFLNVKSLQGNFRLKFEYHNVIDYLSLYNIPLPLDLINNFNVVYENGQNFTTEYIFISPFPFTEFTNLEKTNLDEKLNSFLKNINDEKKNNNLLFGYDTEKQKKLFGNLKQNFLNSEIKEWDYIFNNIFFCRTDYEKEVNIYLVTSYSFGEQPEFIEAINNCTELFDNNTYPIILFHYFNGGGNLTITQYLLELISPKITINLYSAMRYTNIIKKQNGNYVNLILGYLSDTEMCDKVDYNTLTKHITEVDYGNGIKDKLTSPFHFMTKEFRKYLNSKKKKLKNPRNPTDILIYTDGYSYSAASIFMKYLQYYGGGISIGYFPHPYLDFENKDVFDSGLSPTVMGTEVVVRDYDPKGYKHLYEKYNITFTSLSIIQFFYNKKKLNHPLEYEITPVDEILNIYNPDDDYDLCINKSLEKINEYKTYCNPKNKKLVLISDKCDGQFGNKQTHGGYKCGDDGKWTNECIPSYCDIGYIFDFDLQRCVIDPCSDFKFDNGSDSKTIIFIIIAVVALVIIILIIFLIIRKRRRKNIEVDSVEKLNLTEELK